MIDYMALNILSSDDDEAALVLKTMLRILNEELGNIIFIGSLERAKRIAKREKMALPFSALVSSFSELEDAMEKEERIIFFDSPDEKFKEALHTLENTPCMTFLTIGNHDEYIEDLKDVANPNTLSCMILSSDGNRIFPFPEYLERTKESIIDGLVNIESNTHNPFFNLDKPFVLVKEDDIEIDYDWVLSIARVLKMDTLLVKKGEKIEKDECRAVLSFSNLGHGSDMCLYFGLPFYYINAVRMPDAALLSALKITKIIAKDLL